MQITDIIRFWLSIVKFATGTPPALLKQNVARIIGFKIRVSLTKSEHIVERSLEHEKRLVAWLDDKMAFFVKQSWFTMTQCEKTSS